MARLGKDIVALPGQARRGRARLGKVRLGLARRGSARRGYRGSARRGAVGRGMARRGGARLGGAGLGLARKSWLGRARQGVDWHGVAGLGTARLGLARCGKDIEVRDDMRALTLHQPWAQWIADGAKEYETRSWTAKYRGPLLIHASKSEEHLAADELAVWPRGAVLAVATLVEVYPTDTYEVGSIERDMGDWTPGRYAWKLVDVQRLVEPIPWKGRQGLWRPPNSLVDLVAEARFVE